MPLGLGQAGAKTRKKVKKVLIILKKLLWSKLNINFNESDENWDA